MELTDLKSQIEDLKLILLDPKLFIIKYFEDLTNQLDIRTTEFEIKENSSENIDKVNDWRQRIIDKLKQAELKLLNRITVKFKPDLNMREQSENLIKLFDEEFNNNDYAFEKFNEFKKKVNDYSYQMQQKLMGNQCFLVLTNKDIIKCGSIDSPDFCRNVLPIIRVTGGFIGRKGQYYLENFKDPKGELNRELLTVLRINTTIQITNSFPGLGMSFEPEILFPTIDSLPTNGVILIQSGITTIEPFTFTGSKNIEVILLNNNLIKDLHTNSFKGLNNLTSLDLSNNSIESIEPHTFLPLKKLRSLDLCDNKIEILPMDIFKGLKKLTELKLNNNLIKSINPRAFYDLNKLEVLKLKKNKLKHVKKETFVGLDNLEILELTGININSIDPHAFLGLSKLKVLDLKSNKINHILKETFIGLENLQLLDLSCNCIYSIDPHAFLGLSKLYILHLNSNKIKSILKETFKGLQNLNELDLKNSEIELINPSAFSGMDRLKSLELSKNKIKHLSKGSFNGLDNLKILNLENNEIESVDSHIFDCLKQLDKIYLTGNKKDYTYLHKVDLKLNLNDTISARLRCRRELQKQKKEIKRLK